MNLLIKTLKIIGIVLSIILGLAFMAIRRENRKEKADYFIGGYLNNINQLTYKSVKIGTSNLYIKLPFALSPSSVALPQSMKDKLAKFETFIFSKDKSFSGKISYMVWKSGIEYSLETGSDGAIDNIKTLPGVEKVLDDREYFKIGKYEGNIIDGVVYRYGKSFQIKAAILKSGQEVWIVMINFLNHQDENIFFEFPRRVF